MKRSLTIGCVLLVGGGVSNCGGAAEMGSIPGEEHSQAGASGSGAPDAGFVGEIWNRAGAGGAYLGVPIGVGGGTSGSGPQIDSAGADGVVGAGSSGWDAVGAGAGPIAGAGGESGSGDEPPGTTPRSGAGGWLGVPAK
jgi:hypothetical protein